MVNVDSSAMQDTMTSSTLTFMLECKQHHNHHQCMISFNLLKCYKMPEIAVIEWRMILITNDTNINEYQKLMVFKLK